MKTLKEVAKELNISKSKASKLKRKIELKEYGNIPSFMIWGTGKCKSYNIDTFKKYL